MFGPFALKPIQQRATGVKPHVMQGDVRFGGAKVDEGQRQFWVAVVSIGENAVGHHEANHAITHHLLKSFGQVFGEGVGDGFDDFLSVCRQLRDVFLWGLDGFFGHDVVFRNRNKKNGQ